ncbi:FAD-binding oxidoreductase [Marinomonas sp. 15G1-11]|uniref:FAD-binding oxidoreductase n=1 Tax=Marinomonas phaeophyticola TaxID=3004091 RepID=A0ABT4JUK6_9GAMM|nr:FAD-binding oxidoreductase [Marinomonas sp. 15G1-11]MCZ2721921.1 FAD-binding oxidoreductase [Marinomonas sp. 15G1-11]
MNHQKLHPSLWSDTATPRIPVNQLNSHISADVVIIGAGITGSRAALELAKQGLNVVVLESQEPGWGASGRTGGQVNPLAHDTPEKICSYLGEKAGMGVVNAYVNSADEVFSLVKKYDINCDAEQNGWLRTAHCNRSVKKLELMATAWRKVGLDISYVQGNELHRLMGTKTYNTATLTPKGGSVQPLSYTRGLCSAAISLGARVFGHSSVDRIERRDSRWKVTTKSGSVDTKWVVFCTNGYTDSVLKGLNKTIVPLVSLQSATAPLPEEIYNEILPSGYTYADTRRVIFYGRKVKDKRIVFGTLGVSSDCKKTSDVKRLYNGLAETFPQLKGIELTHKWGGQIAHTPDVLPHLHEPQPGILAGLGYNGRGVAMGTVMGRIMAERILGKSAEDLEIPVTNYSNAFLRHFSDTAVKLAVPTFEIMDALERRFT